MSRETLQTLYIDFMNNHLTIECRAEHHGFTTREAELLIQVARMAYNNPHPYA